MSAICTAVARGVRKSATLAFKRWSAQTIVLELSGPEVLYEKPKLQL
jgi:hypothetical protein